MKKLLTLLVIALVAVLAVGCGGGKDAAKDGEAQKKVWKFAHEEVDGSVQDLYVKKFKEIIEKKSGGKIQIDIYPVGQLGDATQQTELLQTGGIEFAMVSPGNTGTIVPENQLFSLHFLFSEDMNINKKVLNESEALYKDLGDIYLEKNIKVLDYWTEGFMDWTSSKELRKPADFKGFKMRTMPSPMIVAAYEAYGANPTPVPYMEVYSGLQLKMIEGQENPMFAIEEMKFYEVQNFLTLSRHNLYVTTTSVNPDFFNGLDKEYQQYILDTVAELKDYSFDIQNDLNSERLEKVKAASKITINELTAEERAAFKEASRAARQKYVDMVGAKGDAILTKLEKEIAAAEEGK